MLAAHGGVLIGQIFQSARDIVQFVETAQRMMSRRHVELSDRARRHLESMHAGRWTVPHSET